MTFLRLSSFNDGMGHPMVARVSADFDHRRAVKVETSHYRACAAAGCGVASSAIRQHHTLNAPARVRI